MSVVPYTWKVCTHRALYHRVTGHCLTYLQALRDRAPAGKDAKSTRRYLNTAIVALQHLGTLNRTPLDSDYRVAFLETETALTHLLTTRLFRSDHNLIRQSILEMDKLVGTWSTDMEIPVCDQAQ